MKKVEIEKKYKLKVLPENLQKYESVNIEQAYLNYGTNPTLRIRKYNENKFIISYKSKKEANRDDLSVCDEVELPISKEAYEYLKEKKDGRIIKKTRYIVPIGDELKVEIDLFHDFFEGVCFAEIEFESEGQLDKCEIPDWIGEDISKEERVKNGYMAISAQRIEDYSDLIIRI